MRRGEQVHWRVQNHDGARSGVVITSGHITFSPLSLSPWLRAGSSTTSRDRGRSWTRWCMLDVRGGEDGMVMSMSCHGMAWFWSG